MCRQVPLGPQSMVFVPFCLKTGINFAHIGLESGAVFKETTVVYERFNNALH